MTEPSKPSIPAPAPDSWVRKTADGNGYERQSQHDGRWYPYQPGQK